MLDGAAWQAGQALDRAIVCGWHAAALPRLKRFPALSDLITSKNAERTEDRRVGQSPQVQAAIVQVLHARLGGTLTSGEQAHV